MSGLSHYSSMSPSSIAWDARTKVKWISKVAVDPCLCPHNNAQARAGAGDLGNVCAPCHWTSEPTGSRNVFMRPNASMNC
ncbi:hypothetical protein XFF6992_50108 [Xanthomonas citri pv. fuscans]|nr:hypothetical protein XFF6992_50108 [Xanthomonas citri pv. fuscans]SOO33680.1 hypothetical protein XFF6994_310010 [Xanthomonas citri pv. fuscans]